MSEQLMNEAQIKISRYLRASAGTANQPTDHCIRCFIGMIEGGEATIEDFRFIGGEWLVNQMQTMADENGWELKCQN